MAENNVNNNAPAVEKEMTQAELNEVLKVRREKLAALQAGLPAGIFTKNEARGLLGYPPVEGGDVMPRGYNELDAPKTDSTGSDAAPTENEV